MLLQMKFDNFGWWNHDTIAALKELQKNGDTPGWYGITPYPKQRPYFVSGATTQEEAIAKGMPANAIDGSLTTPTKLLD